MIFLDANVFLYAVGAAHPLQSPSLQVLERVARGVLQANINSEIVQETLQVMMRKGEKQEALVLAEQMLQIFPHMLPVGRDDIVAATRLLASLPNLSSRDAIHAATMLRNGITEIMSADPDFDRIPGIRRVPIR